MLNLFPKRCTWWCCQLTSWRLPRLQPRRSSCGEVKTMLSHTSASTHSLPCFRETSVWNLGHYHWAGHWWSRLILEQMVGCFCTSSELVCHCQSDFRVHQRTVSYCWWGRRRIRCRIGSWILAIHLFPYNHMVCDKISSPVEYYSGYHGITP